MHIRLENVKKTYQTQNGALDAVNGVTLDIPSNTVYGIIGKSGAGKSTLVRLLSLLEQTDSGMIFYNKERVDNLRGEALIQRRRRTGMIFQNFNLFSSRNAAQNIAYPLEICGLTKNVIHDRVSELLDLVGLPDRGKSPVSTLSGGQKQRVAIARALANNPDILFCDEATSALDPQTTRSILNLLREIQKKMNLTVVMITHQMEVVRDACDSVAVLDNGKIAEQGTVADIFARPKSAVTRDFLSHIPVFDQEERGAASAIDGGKSAGSLVRWSADGGKYILRFVGSQTGEPVLSRVTRNFNVEFNIRAGGVQHLQQQDIGTLITDISGDPAEVGRALTFLAEEGIIVEKNTEADHD